MPMARAVGAASIALSIAFLFFAPSAEAARDLRLKRQQSLKALLTTDAEPDVAKDRAICASGKQPANIARFRSVGALTLPDAADYCIAALTRLARDGTLAFVRDPRSTKPSPAISIDAGFVAGYRKGEAMQAGLPSMVTLKPIAERCFAQKEPDTDLCYATGYAFGTRTYHGETIRVR